MTAAMARPIPVLPDVPSMIVPPGFSTPARSASSIILIAIRSLIELPGLKVSIFATTVPLTMPEVILLMRTIGVSPTASRMFAQIFFTEQVYTDGPGPHRNAPIASSIPFARRPCRDIHDRWLTLDAQTDPRADRRRRRRHQAE